MFMRLLQVKINPDFIKEFKDFYEVTVLPQLQEMSGCIFAGLIKGGPDISEFISLTFWETQQNAEDYEKSGVFTNLIDQARPFLSESTEWKIQLSDKMELEYAPIAEEPDVKKYSVELQKNNDEKIKLQSSGMYIRIVSMKIQTDKLDEFKKIYLEKVIPALRVIEGCRHVFLTESINEKDEFISVTIWDDKVYADNYENGGKFEELVEQTKHTFSQFYLWKMALEKEYSAKIKTTDDMKVETYSIITGKSFI
jgi:heme-degrading monooxygenase HmoA